MELYRRHTLARDAALATVVVLMRLATDHREVNRLSERGSVAFLEAAPKNPLLGLTPAEVRSAIKAAKRATGETAASGSST